MAAIVFHLTNTDNAPNRYAIEQGATFDLLSLWLEGDYSDCLARGQIRKKYKDTTPLIDFTIPPLQYATVTLPDNTTAQKTLVAPTLSAAQTASLPLPKLRTSKRDAVVIGKNVWVYDIELVFPSGKVIRLQEGYVEVTAEVTR